MTYQVLARKWRPRLFADLVGQTHVVQALVNGLTRGQLHHAYLFTGTRGVGKTTLARILAKALNCETGIGPTPCGVCSTCREIDDGRYVDLIEVDAASRTKVDQTRELLDNVPFAPVRGRFKVYLIDEVHMFSASSFNALLKTLEEPPGHVKFVLATTDPQRLPATVLSRCLQFSLKRLLPGQIKGQFQTVLTAEGIAFEDQALSLLAAAADGSMRDGLSLLDQAIAFGGGAVTDADVRLMLGTRSGDLALDLIAALAAGDGARLLAEIDRIAAVTPDFAGILKDLIGLLHRLALAQQVPATLTDDDPDRPRLRALADAIAPEDVQLFYQVLLLGQTDLPLAPDPRAGLEMVLLRALAFRPDDGAPPSTGRATGPATGAPSGRAERSTTAPTSGTAASAAAGQVGATVALHRVAEPPPGTGFGAEAGPARGSAPALAPAASPAAVAPEPPPDRAADRNPSAPPLASTAPVALDPVAPIAVARGSESGYATRASPATDPGHALADAAAWRRFVESGTLTARALELARHCAFVGWHRDRLRLALDPDAAHLRSPAAEQRLVAALAVAIGAPADAPPRLDIAVGPAAPDATPAAQQAQDAAARQAEATAAMLADPVARLLRERLGADFLPGSIAAHA